MLVEKKQKYQNWRFAILEPRMKRAGGENAHAGPDALYNDLDPPSKVIREQPIHRKMVEYAISGMKTKEIAEAIGMTDTTVRRTLKQPWARQRIVEGMKEVRQESLRELLKAVEKDCVQVQVQILKDDNAKNSDRLSASQALLDRLHGKATQPLEHQMKKSLDEYTDEELLKMLPTPEEADHPDEEETAA